MTQSKKQLHHHWTKIRAVKPIYLLIVVLLLAGASAVFLRSNNQQMGELRSAVYAADKADGDIEGALRDLREFVYGHMNTDLSSGATGVYPPIQLKYSYDRLVAAEQQRVQKVNDAIYTDAQAHCEAVLPTGFSGGTRVACIEAYVTANGIKAQPIEDGLYKFDFVSPTFSFDAAGWTIIATVFVALILIIRIAISLYFKKIDVR